MRRNDQPELRLCMRLAKPGTTAIDVGASVGNYALAMRKAVTRSGRVIALEPNPIVYAELANSTWASGVETIRAAASNEAGSSTLYVPKGRSGDHLAPLGSMAHPITGHAQFDIQSLRLDDMETGPSVSLIKIDVEGHESRVLDGAAATIKRDLPFLVVEIEQRHLRGESIEHVVSKLLQHGYRCAGIRGTELVPWSEFDTERHQLQYVVSDTQLVPGSEAAYVNNFVFWHPESHLNSVDPRGPLL